MSLPGYDAWATGGRYSRERLIVHCDKCGDWTPVTAETEYGVTDWTPEECGNCGESFTDDARTDFDDGER